MNRPKNSLGHEVLAMPIGPTPPDSKPVPLAALFNTIWENLAHLHNNGTQEPPAYLKEGGIWARPYDGGRQILQRIAGTGQEQYADVEIWWEKDGKVSFPIGNGRSLPLETVDLNDLKEAGLYRLRDGLLNAPEGISFGNIWVQKTDRSGVDTCCQLVMSDTSISMRNGALNAGIFKWASWTTVISTPALTAADLGKVLTVTSGGPEWVSVPNIFGIRPGMPVPMAGTKLYPNCVWPDRSLVRFADWPELHAEFTAGYLGTVAEADAAEFPDFFVLKADGSGLYLPDVGGLFPRAWRPGEMQWDKGRQAGSYQEDAMQKIQGVFTPAAHHTWVSSSGAFYVTPSTYARPNVGTTSDGGFVNFDSARSTRIADETRTKNYAQPTAIYLGRYKDEV